LAPPGRHQCSIDEDPTQEHNFYTQKHIRTFMRTTLDLPDDLVKRAKITAVKRGSTLRDLVAEALHRLLADQAAPQRKRMTEAPVKLPPGHTIPLRSNSEIAHLFAQEDVVHLNDLYRGR
jgi:predicted DNA binding CopG/RHH family protein